MLYFDHDTTSAVDDKIRALRFKCGGAAIDAYYYIIELMYKDENPTLFVEKPNPLQVGFQEKATLYLDMTAYTLMVTVDELIRFLEVMIEVGLFVKDDFDDCFSITSERVLQSVLTYQQRREVAASNGRKGGRPKKTQVNSAAQSIQAGNQSKNPTLSTSKTQPFSNSKPNQKPKALLREEEEKEEVKIKEEEKKKKRRSQSSSSNFSKTNSLDCMQQQTDGVTFSDCNGEPWSTAFEALASTFKIRTGKSDAAFQKFAEQLSQACCIGCSSATAAEHFDSCAHCIFDALNKFDSSRSSDPLPLVKKVLLEDRGF